MNKTRQQLRLLEFRREICFAFSHTNDIAFNTADILENVNSDARTFYS